MTQDSDAQMLPRFRPLYAQIKELLMQRLQSGEWRPGMMLPSEQTLATDVYTDTVLLRAQIDDGPREVTFEVSDTSDKQGDYYFVRVRQANDAMAWSSPIWVGGYPPR